MKEQSKSRGDDVNVDPEAAQTVHELVGQMKAEGKTVLLNTHRLEEADRLCDRVGILKTRLAAVGSPADLRESLWGLRTVVTLALPTPATMTAAAKSLRTQGWKAEPGEGTLTVVVQDPQRDNPAIVDAVVRAGGRIQGVTQLHPSLEDVYMRLVREAPP